MKHKLTALLLAMAMVLSMLTGCAAKSSGDASTEELPAIDTEAPAEEDHALDALDAGARQDIVDYLTAGTLKNGDTAFTVNGVDVPADFYLYWVAYQATALSQTGMTEEQLDTELEEGETVADFLRETSRDYAAFYACVAQAAEKESITLDETDNAQVESYAASLNEATLLYYATSEEAQRNFYAQHLLGTKLQDLHYGESSGKVINDEDLVSFANDEGYYTCRYLLFPLTDGEGNKLDSEEQKAKCQKAYEELQQVKPDELEATFQTYQEQFNTRENGADGNTEAFTSTTSSVVGGFADIVSALGENELGITEEATEYGYFVILRLPLALSESDTEELRTEYEAVLFDNEIQALVDEADIQWSELADSLDIRAFCLRLGELQQQITEAENAAAEAAEKAEEEAESSADSSAQ